MARKTKTVLIDDIDGSEIPDGGQTVEFAVDGVSYEIDLNDKNAAKMRETFQFYDDHGRRTGGRRRSKGGGSVRTDKTQLDAIRRRARENGHQVNDRGRIKKEIMDAFEAAH